jgi:hypothetical protein
VAQYSGNVGYHSSPVRSTIMKANEIYHGVLCSNL